MCGIAKRPFGRGWLAAVTLGLATLAAASANAAPLDLTYIPTEAAGAVVLHPRALLTGEGSQWLPTEVITAARAERSRNRSRCRSKKWSRSAPAGRIAEAGVWRRRAIRASLYEGRPAGEASADQ